MNITHLPENGKLTLALDGRLDAVTSAQFEAELLPAFGHVKNVELDCTRLSYVSSAGLRVLLLGQKTAKAQGATLALKGVSEDVMEVLNMTGFSDILTIQFAKEQP